MPRLRPGRDQLNIVNVADGVIKEFEELRLGKGPGGKDVPRWELFERIFAEWKKFTYDNELIGQTDPPRRASRIIIMGGRGRKQQPQESDQELKKRY